MSVRLVSRIALAVCTTGVLTLAGCSSDDSGRSAVEKTVPSSSVSAKKGDPISEENFHLHDGYVKAIPAGAGMTAVFGMLENHNDQDITVVGFKTSLGDDALYEIHEVVDGKMQMKEGGITVKAHSHSMLQPGGDHLMIMGYDKAIEAGSDIVVTLELASGENIVISDVPARTIAAGEEDYSGHEGHEGHDHSGHEGHNMENMTEGNAANQS